MATYNEDGTNDYVPGESNARAVPADPPSDADAGGAIHRPTAPGRPAHPAHPEERPDQVRPTPHGGR